MLDMLLDMPLDMLLDILLDMLLDMLEVFPRGRQCAAARIYQRKSLNKRLMDGDPDSREGAGEMKISKKQNSAGARLHFGVLVHVRERRHVSSWLFALAGRACRTCPQQCNFKRWRKQTTAGVECARNQSWANLGTNCGADTESVSSSRPAINQAANLPTCLSRCFKPIAASLSGLAWRC